MENPTDWSAELEEIVQDLLMEALTVELCRGALFRRREEGGTCFQVAFPRWDGEGGRLL